jgi:hypothetical protein
VLLSAAPLCAISVSPFLESKVYSNDPRLCLRAPKRRDAGGPGEAARASFIVRGNVYSILARRASCFKNQGRREDSKHPATWISMTLAVAPVAYRFIVGSPAKADW